MDAEELNKRAMTAGVPRAIVEKDYALSVVLLGISKSPLAAKVVFKGGTALKKAYFPEARFSEDLDFSVAAGDENGIMAGLKALFEGKELNGVRFIALEREKTRAGLRVALKFSSVLGQPQRIRFDFSFRENLALKPEEKIVADDYGLGEAKLLILPLEELFAEKIRALFGRTAARDLYDVWFLFKRGVKTSKRVIEKKFAYYEEKYEPAALKDKLESFRRDWKRDLAQFIKQVPDFDATANETINFLDRQWKG
ncbi:MAG: nucleotidyl transferase AbiEii/AbiGii toxin family protein [Candidatus Micrarchaeota archaeon]|nr:nucleotidyl transferase AbiEii/AbiGii toxin family protein [Candidatus Micrarchaeota archaeon]